jgi:hypothetical protein
MDERKQLCVVFDIDETLIHFISNKYTSLLGDMDPALRTKFREVKTKDNVILLRPHIEELFDFFKATPNIRVGLWTYSEREYSEGIAKILTDALNLPKRKDGTDFFMFTWGAEDMDEDSGIIKDLTQVYRNFPNFNKFNTFLVDDLYKNVRHEINQQNCVLIQPFAPFGTSKVRANVGVEEQTNASNDTAFKDLIMVCQHVLQDILNCESEEIDDAFTTETVFNEKRIKRMKLSSFLKTYATKFINLFTIGRPMQTKEFIMVEPNNYGIHIKGGRRTYRKKPRKRRTKRRYLT